MPLESLSSKIRETNIADSLDEKLLGEIGEAVVEGYNTDLASRQEWVDKVDSYLKLASQVVEEKSYPWPKAANVKYPLLTEASTQFASRAYPALVPSHNVVRGRVVGFDETGEKEKKAIRIGKHMSYQLLEEMEEWEEDMDKLCNVLPIVGCAFKKTYYSGLKKRNVSELVMPKDLVVNYWAKNLEDCERKTHVLELSENQIQERVLAGIFREVELGTPSKEINRSTSNEIQGTSNPRNDDTKPFAILECHTWWDLDDDGYKEPYIITVLEDTKDVLRIVARYDMESIEADNNGKVLRIQATEYFTKFGFIPNPDGGFYDVGFGQLLGPINHTIDTTINQLLDAGTLSTLPSGFLARGIRLKKGESRIVPGEWKTVNSTGDDLRKGIVPLPIKEPSSTLFALLGLMINSGEKLAGTLDSLVGENPGQNQKATTTLAVIEQGMKVFNSIYKRLHRSLKREYKRLYALNKIYLPKESYFTVLDPMNETQEQIFRSDYEENVADVIPSSDPNIATEEQRLAKAMGLFDLIALGTINPVEATRRILEAQNQYGIEQLMTVQDQGPPPELQLEMTKAADESDRKWAELELEAAKVRAQVAQSMALAMKAMAEADRADASVKIDQYKADLDRVMGEADITLRSLETATKMRSMKNESGEGGTQSMESKRGQ